VQFVAGAAVGDCQVVDEQAHPPAAPDA
jgi:hypothetical protein